MTRFVHHMAASIALLGCLAFPAVSRAEKPLTLGLYSYFSSTELYRHFTPLAEHLSKELNRPVKIMLEVDYDVHLNKLHKGEIDIAFLGPASYVSYTKRFGTLPLLAVYESNGSRLYKGYIAVKNDSPITMLSQLKGKKFAFGDTRSTMGHIVPRYLLLKAGVGIQQLARYNHLDNQDNVALGILAGNYDAGGIRESIYNKYAPEGLRAIAISEPMPDHLFVARSGLPEDTVRNVARILRSLKNTEEGRKVLNSLQKELTALVEGSDADYNPLRRIIEQLARAGINL